MSNERHDASNHSNLFFVGLFGLSSKKQQKPENVEGVYMSLWHFCEFHMENTQHMAPYWVLNIPSNIHIISLCFVLLSLCLKLMVYSCHLFIYNPYSSALPYNWCCHGPLTRYLKLRVAHAPGMQGTFSHHWPQRKPLVSDPGMHHGTCVNHVPWFMSGSLTCDDGEKVSGIPGACATDNFSGKRPID